MAELLTISEAARRLHLSRARVLALIKAGRLPARRVRVMEWRVDAADVEAHERQPTGWPKGDKRAGPRGPRKETKG